MYCQVRECNSNCITCLHNPREINRIFLHFHRTHNDTVLHLALHVSWTHINTLINYYEIYKCMFVTILYSCVTRQSHIRENILQIYGLCNNCISCDHTISITHRYTQIYNYYIAWYFIVVNNNRSWTTFTITKLLNILWLFSLLWIIVIQ